LTRTSVLIALAGLSLTTACRRDPIFVEMSDSTFVQTMIALRKLPVGPGIDVASRDLQRDSILRAFGVTAAHVESTAVRLANDPARAADIWRAIDSPTTDVTPQKKNGT
jgi:hypothetical protein